MKLAIALCLLSIAGVSLAEFIFCDLTTGFGCPANGVFSTSYGGKTPGANKCHRNYRMRINLNSNNHDGYKCTFWFRRPKANRYLYSIAENPFASWYTASTAYSYGYGEKARTATKAGTYHQDWSWPQALERDNAQYPWITYEVRDRFMRMQSENGAHYVGKNPLLYTPRTRVHYIGLNRRYKDTFRRGHGMCYMHCFTYAKTRFQLAKLAGPAVAPTDPESATALDFSDEGGPPLQLLQNSGGSSGGSQSGGGRGGNEPER